MMAHIARECLMGVHGSPVERRQFSFKQATHQFLQRNSPRVSLNTNKPGCRHELVAPSSWGNLYCGALAVEPLGIPGKLIDPVGWKLLFSPLQVSVDPPTAQQIRF